MGRPAPLDTALAKAIFAYRLGRSKPIAMSDGPSGALFRRLGQEYIRSRLDDANYRYYTALRDLSRQAIDCARGGDLDRAGRLLADADNHLTRRPAADEAGLLSRSWVEQAAAYVATRHHDWPRAHARLAAAMQADRALEEQFGYDLFHIARVHTAHLWLRIEAGAGNLMAAIDLAQEVVDYLLERRELLSIDSGWSADRLHGVPDDLRLAMIARVASEVGLQLARCPRGAARRLFARFPAWRQFASHPTLSEIYDWGGAKRAFLAGDTAGFLTRAEAVLANGRCETTLWSATALDVIRVCRALRTRATRRFCEEVQHDASAALRLAGDGQATPLNRLMAAPARNDPGRRYRHRPADRRFHLVAVGLPRSGTSSLSTLFARYRSGHEFMGLETIRRCLQRRNGGLTDRTFGAFLRRRDREGALEVDAAGFHHWYVDLLVERFPDARFVVLVRDPYAWTNANLKMLVRWHERQSAATGPGSPPWMSDYGAMLFGDAWPALASRDAVAANIDRLADAFLGQWVTANRRLLALLPRPRTLIVRTERIASSVAAIARFSGVPIASLTAARLTNANTDRSDWLQALGRPWIDARVASVGSDVAAAIEREAS